MSAGLEVAKLVVARGGKPVIHGIDIEIRPGRITALLGANGAGKSSLVLALGGVLPVLSGSISLGGKSLNGLRSETIRASGIAAVPEGHLVLGDLTVEDNLRVAGGFLPRSELEKSIREALDTFPELTAKLKQRARELSGGQQQMLVLAQAMVGRPRFLLADELSFGLAPVVVSRLVPIIQRFAEQGIGVLLIEQFTHIALNIAHHAYVMERGHIRFSGSPDELKRNPDILHSAYLAAG